jgi:hypothetical protein
MAEPLEGFESWLLHRVDQAVEAGEVPEALLTELQAESESAKESPQEEGQAAAIRQIADPAGIDWKHAEGILDTLEAQPTATRDLLMRRIAETWLEGQRTEWGLRRKPENHG